MPDEFEPIRLVIRGAHAFLVATLGNEIKDIRVEELETPATRHGHDYQITLSYVDPRDPQTMASLALPGGQRRRYKSFEVDANGNVLSMKIRPAE